MSREKAIDPAIIEFAKSMQRKLDLNKDKKCDKMNPDGKGRTWEHCELSWLLYRLRQETLELEEALRHANRDDIMSESADVGNFAMMIHDIASRWQAVKPQPHIVCLCGSTRFTELMLIKQWEFTKLGRIVLSWCALPNSYCREEKGPHLAEQEGIKEIVDEGHLRKIDLADSVYVLNVGGYIGESTRKEIEYAEAHNKPIEYLEKGGD